MCWTILCAPACSRVLRFAPVWTRCVKLHAPRRYVTAKSTLREAPSKCLRPARPRAWSILANPAYGQVRNEFVAICLRLSGGKVVTPPGDPAEEQGTVLTRLVWGLWERLFGPTIRRRKSSFDLHM